MCLIVDANVAAIVLTEEPDVRFLPVAIALRRRTARMVVGGSRLREEYRRIDKIRTMLARLDRLGSTRQIPDELVDTAERAVMSSRLCASDDEHVIALAQVSHARLLCSHDRALHSDFTNPRLLKPPGSVYQAIEHKHLLEKHCSKYKARKVRQT